MRLLKSLKKILVSIIIYIFLFEIIFQSLFLLNLDFIKNPNLFYNGYCDQKYWNMYNKKTKISKNILYHPILSYSKNDVFIPKKFTTNIEKKENNFKKNEISLYGSSYINHVDLKKILKTYSDVNFINYSLESYGLDQIYLSYKLTSHLNQNRTIILGFLLEDLDRSIFNYRDYHKAQFIFKGDDVQLINVPINQEIKNDRINDFYLVKFLLNFYELIINDFDPRVSDCSIEEKKKLFKYFFDDIKKDSLKFNQKIVVITFNLKEDLTNKSTWRYRFIKDYLAKNNMTHIDSLKIMKNKSIEFKEKTEDYFGIDGHNNEKSFKYIFNNFFKIYKAM